jgi:hypothetical protein
MTIEESVAALTTSTTALVTAVGTQQLAITAAVAGMVSVTTRVNTGLRSEEHTSELQSRV